MRFVVGVVLTLLLVFHTGEAAAQLRLYQGPLTIDGESVQAAAVVDVKSGKVIETTTRQARSSPWNGILLWFYDQSVRKVQVRWYKDGKMHKQFKPGTHVEFIGKFHLLVSDAVSWRITTLEGDAVYQKGPKGTPLWMVPSRVMYLDAFVAESKDEKYLYYYSTGPRGSGKWHQLKYERKDRLKFIAADGVSHYLTTWSQLIRLPNGYHLLNELSDRYLYVTNYDRSSQVSRIYDIKTKKIKAYPIRLSMSIPGSPPGQYIMIDRVKDGGNGLSLIRVADGKIYFDVKMNFAKSITAYSQKMIGLGNLNWIEIRGRKTVFKQPAWAYFDLRGNIKLI